MFNSSQNQASNISSSDNVGSNQDPTQTQFQSQIQVIDMDDITLIPNNNNSLLCNDSIMISNPNESSEVNVPVTIVTQIVPTVTTTNTISVKKEFSTTNDILMIDDTMPQATVDPKIETESVPKINDSNETIQTAVTPVATPIIQVAAPIDNQLIQTNNNSILSTNKILDPAIPQVQLPIKLSGTQPLFLSNQVIGSNVQPNGNTWTSISYILPNNSLNAKQTNLVQKGQTINMAPTIVSNIANAQITTDGTSSLINTGPTLINQSTENNSKCVTNPSSTVKFIQTNQRHLVFSPIKATATISPVTKPINQASNQNLLKSTVTKTTVNVTNTESLSKASYTAPAIVSTNANQQQQLIILSPVKTNQNNKSSYIPTLKILPNTKLPTIAPATSAKRVIAPAPITKSISSVASTTRPIQTTSNKNVHYISFVPFSSSHQINTTSTSKYVPLKPSTSTKTTPTNTTIKPNMVQLGQKVLVNPSSIKISATVASSAPSGIVTSQSNNSIKKTQPTSIWMLPKQIVQNSTNAILAPKPAAKFIPIAPNPNQANTFQEVQKIALNSIPKNIIDNYEESRRKACNCTRSQCLKLYCDCFANGEFCNNCNCVSCCNNLEHEEIRQKAIRLCLERNPNAFHPKIGQSHHGDIERRHTKGCCCKRSGCLKNYCECYEAKILCSDKCKCIACKNFEESAERKTLMHLADAAEVRSAQQSVASKMHVWGPDFKSKLPVKVKSDCHPFNVLTNDILEATASCLLAQAEEGEFENHSEENIEGLILDQFGECLSQILNLANNGDDFDGNSEDDDTTNDMVISLD